MQTDHASHEARLGSMMGQRMCFLGAAFCLKLSIAPIERLHSTNRARSHNQMRWQHFAAQFVNAERRAFSRKTPVPASACNHSKQESPQHPGIKLPLRKQTAFELFKKDWIAIALGFGAGGGWYRNEFLPACFQKCFLRWQLRAGIYFCARVTKSTQHPTSLALNVPESWRPSCSKVDFVLRGPCASGSTSLDPRTAPRTTWLSNVRSAESCTRAKLNRMQSARPSSSNCRMTYRQTMISSRRRLHLQPE